MSHGDERERERVTPLESLPIEPLRDAAQLLNRENDRLIREVARLQRERVKLKRGCVQERTEELERQLAAMRQETRSYGFPGVQVRSQGVAARCAMWN